MNTRRRLRSRTAYTSATVTRGRLRSSRASTSATVTPRRLRSRTARTSAVVALLACLTLATTAGLALARTKSCAKINSNCATTVKAIPPPKSTIGAPPPPVGQVAISVKTAPTSALADRRQPGRLIAAPQPGQRIACLGYQPKDPTPVTFQLKTATPVNIVYAITDRITNTTADGVHFCLAANFGFRTASGRPARAAKLPDGTPGHIGLLPPCPKPLPPPGATRAPCVESITTVPDENSVTKVDVLVKARVPTRTKGDPWGSS